MCAGRRAVSSLPVPKIAEYRQIPQNNRAPDGPVGSARSTEAPQSRVVGGTGMLFEQTASNRKQDEGGMRECCAAIGWGRDSALNLSGPVAPPNDFAVTSLTSITTLLERAA